MTLILDDMPANPRTPKCKEKPAKRSPLERQEMVFGVRSSLFWNIRSLFGGGCIPVMSRLVNASKLSSVRLACHSRAPVLVPCRFASSDERKALRVKAKEAQVGKVLQFVEKAKEKSLIGLGVLGCFAIAGVAGVLLWKRFSGSSEYVVFEKAISLIENDERIRKEFGGDLYFYGERTNDRVIGRHAGIKHVTFVNPASGNKVCSNDFFGDFGLFFGGLNLVLGSTHGLSFTFAIHQTCAETWWRKCFNSRKLFGILGNGRNLLCSFEDIQDLVLCILTYSRTRNRRKHLGLFRKSNWVYFEKVKFGKTMQLVLPISGEHLFVFCSSHETFIVLFPQIAKMDEGSSDSGSDILPSDAGPGSSVIDAKELTTTP